MPGTPAIVLGRPGPIGTWSLQPALAEAFRFLELEESTIGFLFKGVYKSSHKGTIL